MGSMFAPNAGVDNVGTIGTINNAQGSNNTNGVLTLADNLPSNYNIIISSTTSYGQLLGSGVSGTMNFGVFGLTSTGYTAAVTPASVVTNNTLYTNVLSGITASQLTGTTGTYDGYSWRLQLETSSSTVWDLLFGTLATNITNSLVGSSNDLGTSLNPKLDGGTLRVDSAGAISTALTVTTNNGIIDQHGLASTFSGIISDDTPGQSGGITLINTGSGGSVTLNAVNTYTGVTTISSGTMLALSGNGSIAASSGVIDNGVMDISAANGSVSLSNLSGSGTLTLGARTLNLTNANDTFSGSIGGSGSLNITGGSELLTGVNSYTGTTTITSGQLEVGDASSPTASIGGDVLVQLAGTLRGHGTVAGSVTNSGIVSPGGSIGTLTVSGDYTQNSNASLDIELAPTITSKLVVSGVATLAGALVIMPDNGTYTRGHSYQILTANNGVAGAFSTISNTHAGIAEFLVSYKPDEVDLIVNSGETSFHTVPSLTTDQSNVASVLDKIPLQGE